MSQILINIFTPQELNHSSYIQTGLFELEKESFLKTKVKLSFSKRLGTIRIEEKKITETQQPHPKTSFYQLIDTKSGKTINFATDLYDASTSFSKYALEHCDYVFKRNFEAKHIEVLPIEYQKKIVSLGLTFGCHSASKKAWHKFFIGFVLTNIRLNLKFDSYFVTRLKKKLKLVDSHWKFINTSRLIESFEVKSAIENNQDILFQTRCFASEEQKDVQEIHLQRYRIIQSLRERFGNQFKGGFIPSEVAQSKYPKALTNLPTDPESYLTLVKNSKVVIYTRGLIYSPAWKMAEYLSQGKVIIAEKLTTELPVPLENGREVLFFQEENELIPLIEKVLEDSQLSKTLSQNAKKYFETHVHPKANMRRIITFMLDQNT